LLFLASFFGVFASLVLITNYLGAQLKAAGYDVSRIILIGLDSNSSAAPASRFALPWGLDSNMTTHTMFDLKDFEEKGYLQVAALILTLLSSIFIYLKFGTASEYIVSAGQIACSLQLLLQSASPCSILRYGKSSRCQKRLLFLQTQLCKRFSFFCFCVFGHDDWPIH
jgi:hypothetical protein